MAITNFIPTVWSENLYKALDKKYIGAANCNREYEGDIKEMGSVVKIPGVGKINIELYTKNTDMANPQTLADTVKELRIDQAKYFNFQIDDIDRAQSTPRLMDAAMSVAASSLANEADSYIYSKWSDTSHTISNASTDTTNILDLIIKARELLYTYNVSDTSDIVLEVSPAIAAIILKAKILTATDNTDAFENGYLGNILGCKIYVSGNIHTEDAEPYIFHKCFMRTKRAIAYAEQLSEINAYRPEKRFADAVKGLHLYGAKVIYPDEFVVLDLGVQIDNYE